MLLRHTPIVAALIVAAGPALAAPLAPSDEGPGPEKLAQIAATVGPSLVRVEITAQYDKGESPGGDPWEAWRAWYAAASDPESAMSQDSWSELIKEERPREQGGYLVAPNLVITTDPGLHPRFIKSIRVRSGSTVVDATPHAYGKDEPGLVLQLQSPLAGAKPLAFEPGKPGPYYAVGYGRRDSAWSVGVTALPTSVRVMDDGRKFTPGPAAMLVVDAAGTPVTVTGSGSLAADGSWKVPPLNRPSVASDEMSAMLSRVETAASGALLRVTINFRSPRTEGNENPYGRYYNPMGENGQDEMTEWHGTGVLTDGKTVLVLANLEPKTTGRLERIRIYTADGTEHRGTFAGTLKDWGAMLATLDAPLTGAAKISSEPITAQRNRLLLKAEIQVRGETRTGYYSHDRITGYGLGWRGNIFPTAAAARTDESDYMSRMRGGAETPALNFLFTTAGDLVAVPMERRERMASSQDRWSYSPDSGAVQVPVAIVTETLAQGAGSLDSENKPLSEAEEERLAWLGAELQALTPELARLNKVSEYTRDGRSGGIITYLYPDSPAAKAGLNVGDLILRLHIEGQPRPLEVTLEEGMEGMFDQFWANMDQIPDEYFDQYFDQMPKPWGSAETPLTRALTDLGFGTPFKAEVFRNGKVETIGFAVTQGPAHFDAAPRYKSEDLGITVRDITYEVRRYFQMTPDDPGVIISKVERGGKAAVAGLKPMETIRTINDQPVRSAADFEKIVGQGGELRLAVKRLTQGRTVKLKAEPAANGGTPEAGR